MRRIVTIILCAVMATVIGCGGAKGPRKYRVKGTVTFDGETIDKGYIIFQPKALDDKAEGGEIVDGMFEVIAMPGDKKVEITGTKSHFEKTPKGDEIEVEQNYIPARYNAKSILTAEVTEDAKSNDFEFELKSK